MTRAKLEKVSIEMVRQIVIFLRWQKEYGDFQQRFYRPRLHPSTPLRAQSLVSSWLSGVAVYDPQGSQR